MLNYLTWVKCFVRQKQNVRVVLLHACYDLPKVYGSSYQHCIRLVYPHSVEIAITVNPHHVLVLRHVGKETHALKVSVPEHPVGGYYELVGPELIENRLE